MLPRSGAFDACVPQKLGRTPPPMMPLGAQDPSKYPALRLALRGYIGYSESVVLAWLEKKQVKRAVLETMLLSGILAAVRVGLASEPSPPMSPEEAEKLARRYRRRFGLP